jgi:hypothetical protein
MPDVRAGLEVRLLADKTTPSYDPATGYRNSWPLAGLKVTSAPALARIPTSFVDRGRNAGWITVEGEQVYHRPGGPPSNPFAITHTFKHVDVIVLHDIDGDVRYRVTHQPDKYADNAPDDEPVTDDIYAAGETRVDWFYDATLED